VTLGAIVSIVKLTEVVLVAVPFEAVMLSTYVAFVAADQLITQLYHHRPGPFPVICAGLAPLQTEAGKEALTPVMLPPRVSLAITVMLVLFMLKLRNCGLALALASEISADAKGEMARATAATRRTSPKNRIIRTPHEPLRQNSEEKLKYIPMGFDAIKMHAWEKYLGRQKASFN